MILKTKKIGLIEVDGNGKFPNLPLMKISAHHKKRGDSVEWAFGFEHYDVLYMSKIFTNTPDDLTCYDADEVVRGGSGYDLINKLPDEIEHIYPDYDLYKNIYGKRLFHEAYGFVTRGCPRRCEFCIVPAKEGRRSVQVAELSEFWRGQNVIKLLDPNLLACRNREKILCSLIDCGARIDFTQGLDIRLVDKTIAELINKIKIEMLHFAWDSPDEDLTDRFIFFKNITQMPYQKLKCYVLTNFDSSHSQDLERVQILRKIGVDPYIMVYNKDTAPKITRRLQRYVNNRRLWRTFNSFQDFLSFEYKNL